MRLYHLISNTPMSLQRPRCRSSYRAVVQRERECLVQLACLKMKDQNKCSPITRLRTWAIIVRISFQPYEKTYIRFSFTFNS
ncbi:hypothetical protein SORBI_3004G137801 [Sorghum bicolor]|uniref:Uncharacterized protein n=1 Tax=Sorghum bicolor TaxID=4558 RepID=A0A1Z5RMF5_SORBI|nr:hypothetical protein SORBI_3004G137801 [Sorghum bicolor]